ncbi:hypothetical protein [Lacunimicrobium album]
MRDLSYECWKLSFLLAFILTMVPVAHGQAPQVKNDSIENPEPLIVDFGDGHTLEFVGITKNTAKAEEGWRPDGKPLEKPGYWKSTIVLHGGNTSGAYTENGEHPEPDENALDFLFRWKGLKAQPSITFEMPTTGSSFHNNPVEDPYQLRVSGRLREAPAPGTGLLTPAHAVAVGFTDQPWGPWVKISPEGKVLNPIQGDDPYASTYKLIEVLGSAPPEERVPGVNQVVIRQPSSNKDPSDEWHHYSFEFRGIDTDGKEHWAMMMTGRSDGGAFQTCEYGLSRPLPEGKTFSHYEYRVRPYKYWVTFDHVSMKAGEVTEPGFTARVWP